MIRNSKLSADDLYREGNKYFFGNNGVQKDFKKAVEFYKQAVQQGHAETQANLGGCYYNGQGVAQDYQEAVRFYRLSAEQGNAMAQNNLGLCYDNGQGVAQDYQEAVRLYRLSAEQGDAWGQFNLGVFYEKGQGVAQDYQEAVRLYRLAAEQGHARAQANLGLCYQNGQGVAQDSQEAVRLYRLSAEQGNAQAQVNLGFCYENGQGVAQDYQEAVRLYRLSAEQGYAVAQNNLGVCYEGGQGVAQDYQEAVRLYRLSAEQGYAWGQAYLGFCYEKGQGVLKNLDAAIDLYRKSAKQKNPAASAAISRFKKYILFENERRLKSGSGLLQIDYSSISLDEKEIQKIIETLKKHPEISSLNLSYCNLTEKKVETLLAFIKTNDVIIEINLQGNKIEESQQQKFNEITEKNKSALNELKSILTLENQAAAERMACQFFSQEFSANRFIINGRWHGYTPLMIAVLNRWRKLSYVLYQKGAKLETPCQNLQHQGKRVFEIVKETNLKQIFGSLLTSPVSFTDLNEQSIEFALQKIDRQCSEKVIFSKCHFESKNWSRVYKALEKNKSLAHLSLSNNGLEDSDIKLLLETIHKMPQLKVLLLEKNKLSYQGSFTLFESLVKHPSLELISLRQNRIKQADKKILKEKLGGLLQTYSCYNKLIHIDLTGNYFISKRHLAERVNVLSELLHFTGMTALRFSKALWEKETRSNNPEKRKLCFSIEGKEHYFEVPNDFWTDTLESYREKIGAKGDRDLFEDLQKGLSENLLEHPLWGDIQFPKLEINKMKEVRQKTKQLLWRHQQAPLKSYLKSHKILDTQNIHSIEALLCPEYMLTPQHWKVYLIANNKGISTEQHMMLGWEGLTNYGQRVLKIAHLTLKRQSETSFQATVQFAREAISGSLNKVTIEYFEINLSKIEAFRKTKLIAAFDATKQQVRRLQEQINYEINDNLEARYKLPFSHSSLTEAEKETMVTNCQTWAIDKLETYCENIKIIACKLPSNTVKQIINNTVIEQEESEKSSGCLVM